MSRLPSLRPPGRDTIRKAATIAATAPLTRDLLPRLKESPELCHLQDSAPVAPVKG